MLPIEALQAIAAKQEEYASKFPEAHFTPEELIHLAAVGAIVQTIHPEWTVTPATMGALYNSSEFRAAFSKAYPNADLP